jgi:cell division protein FtsB
MKIFAVIILVVLLGLVGVQIFSFFKQENDLNKALADVQARLVKAQNDEANLSATMQYLSNPTNLSKELRSQFNYKKPGETMIVIVPSASSTGN